ncbi:MAG: hypothetical protein ACTHZ1_08635 [Sphingobacterium sp.]
MQPIRPANFSPGLVAYRPSDPLDVQMRQQQRRTAWYSNPRSDQFLRFTKGDRKALKVSSLLLMLREEDKAKTAINQAMV